MLCVVSILFHSNNDALPSCVRSALPPLVRQLDRLDDEIRLADDAIKPSPKDDDIARRLTSGPRIGPVTASAIAAIAASVQDVSSFSGSREFAAYLGLVPKQNSSGGKERLVRVSKMGNHYLRKLLFVGAHAVPSQAPCRRLANLGVQVDRSEALGGDLPSRSLVRRRDSGEPIKNDIAGLFTVGQSPWSLTSTKPSINPQRTVLADGVNVTSANPKLTHTKDDSSGERA
jgi:hypothetical protein